jgi:hypothetical protein
MLKTFVQIVLFGGVAYYEMPSPPQTAPYDPSQPPEWSQSPPPIETFSSRGGVHQNMGPAYVYPGKRNPANHYVPIIPLDHNGSPDYESWYQSRQEPPSDLMP